MSSPRFFSAGQSEVTSTKREVGDQHRQAIARVDSRPEAPIQGGSMPGNRPASARLRHTRAQPNARLPVRKSPRVQPAITPRLTEVNRIQPLRR